MTELVSTARGRFAVHAAGPPGGRPVVLVAGLGDDHASWDPILEYLTPAYRCTTFDNRGIGASPITPGPYRIAELAEDVHALHQALGLPPCVAIGSSMGGAIGQEWALRYPADVAGVVLSNTWGRTDAFLRVLFEHWISLAGKGGADQLLDSMLLFCMSAGYLAAKPDTVTEFRASTLPDLEGFQAAAAPSQGHDAQDRRGALAQPALVLAGRHDILTRPELSEELVNVLPHAELRLLEAGHMTFWETPETWGPAVTEWIGAQSWH